MRSDSGAHHAGANHTGASKGQLGHDAFYTERRPVTRDDDFAGTRSLFVRVVILCALLCCSKEKKPELAVADAAVEAEAAPSPAVACEEAPGAFFFPIP